MSEAVINYPERKDLKALHKGEIVFCVNTASLVQLKTLIYTLPEEEAKHNLSLLKVLIVRNLEDLMFARQTRDYRFISGTEVPLGELEFPEIDSEQ
jgi:hypothetical protein